MKKNKNKKIITGISILVLTLLFLNFSGFLSVFISQPTGFIQYTDRPSCSGTWCTFFDPIKQSSSNVVEINTGKNIFKFESNVESVVEKKVCKTLSQLCSASSIGGGVPTYIDSDGCQHWKFTYRSIKNWGYYRDPCGSPSSGADCFVRWNGAYCETGDRYGGYNCGVCFGATQVIEDYGGAYISTTSPSGLINRACSQKINVYKDNSLIDTLYSESTMGESNKVYYDDLGSHVSVHMDTSWFYGSVCSAYQNSYNLALYENAFTLNVSSPKEEYLQGENILVDVGLINNLQTNFDAILEINYEVPTIFGAKTKSISYNVVVLPGENTFSYSVPTDEPLSELRVKPKIRILYPTNLISGVNYNFGTGEVVNINSQSNFQIGSSEEEWSSIRVISLAGYYQEQLNLTEAELALLNASLQEKLNLIEQYSGDLDIQLYLISQMELTLEEKKLLVANLQLELDEQILLVGIISSNLDEQIAIANALNLDIASQNIMIQELTDNLAEKLIWLDQLKITTAEQGILLAEMKLNFADQAFILDNLNNTVQEDAIVIKNLNLSLQDEKRLLVELQITHNELLELMALLNLSLEESVEIIADLRLTLDEERLLISQLTSEIEKQNELLELLQEYRDTPAYVHFFADYKFYILAIGLLVLLIGFSLRKKK